MRSRLVTFLRLFFPKERRSQLPPRKPFEIRTERLLLRELHESDVAAMHDYHRDPQALQYLSRTTAYEEKEVLDLIRVAQQYSATNPRVYYVLGIVLAEENRLIGECYFNHWYPRPGKIRHHSGMIGYILHPDYWGRGYATEVARALLYFAFADLRLDYVQGGCLPENGASRRVMEKAGMRLQGSMDNVPGAPEGVESLVFYATSDWLKQNGTKEITHSHEPITSSCHAEPAAKV